MQRRLWLKTGLVAPMVLGAPLIGGCRHAGAAAALTATAARPVVPAKRPVPRSLDVLMLGGTGFLGPTLLRALLSRGHRVTLFNRGITNPGLFPYLEQLRGDREAEGGAGLGALRGRRFDLVVDTWQRGPLCVADTAQLLSGQVPRYAYISSISVYHRRAFAEAGITESAPLSDVEGAVVDRSPDRERYYVRKTLSEQLLQARFDGEVVILRSHGIRGARVRAGDSEAYWPVRIWRGGEVLAPEDGRSLAQFTDAESLAVFLAQSGEEELAGAFNVMNEPFQLAALFQAVSGLSRRPVSLRWTPRATLAGLGIEPYRDLPLWRPDPPGFYGFDTRRARSLGFAHRSLLACAASMLDGYFERHPDDDYAFDRPGQLSAARESAALAALASGSHRSESDRTLR